MHEKIEEIPGEVNEAIKKIMVPKNFDHEA